MSNTVATDMKETEDGLETKNNLTPQNIRNNTSRSLVCFCLALRGRAKCPAVCTLLLYIVYSASAQSSHLPSQAEAMVQSWSAWHFGPFEKIKTIPVRVNSCRMKGEKKVRQMSEKGGRSGKKEATKEEMTESSTDKSN